MGTKSYVKFEKGLVLLEWPMANGLLVLAVHCLLKCNLLRLLPIDRGPSLSQRQGRDGMGRIVTRVCYKTRVEHMKEKVRYIITIALSCYSYDAMPFFGKTDVLRGKTNTRKHSSTKDYEFLCPLMKQQGKLSSFSSVMFDFSVGFILLHHAPLRILLRKISFLTT